MKSEWEIRTNLNQKLAIWITGVAEKDRERLKEHIGQLDWVLSDSDQVIRPIEDIVAEVEEYER